MNNAKYIRSLVVITVLALLLISEGSALAAGKTITVLPWKYNGPPSESYISSAMDDMFFSRLASVEGLETSKGAKEASTAEDAIKSVGKTKTDYIFFGSLSSLGGNISVDGQLIWVKSKATIAFSMAGSGVNSLVGLADKLTKDVSSAIRGEGAITSKTGAVDKTEVTYNGKFDKQIEVVDVSKATPPTSVAVIKPPVSQIANTKKATGLAVKAKTSGRAKDFIFKSKIKKEFIKAITTADLNKDGIKEIITVSERNIYINQFLDGEIKLVQKIKTPKGTNHLALSVLNAPDGSAESVHIASLYKDKSASKVLRYIDGDYVITKENIRYITRVLTVGKVQALIGQEYKFGRGFIDNYYILDESFKPLEELKVGGQSLPKGYNILSLVLSDFTGNGNSDVMVLGSTGHIKMFQYNVELEEEEEVSPELIETWRSSDKFGGSLNKVEFIKNRATTNRIRGVNFDSGFKVYDTDGDGTVEIVSRANIAGGIMGQYAKTKRSFDKGTVRSMSFDGALMANNWETKVMQGYISDFVIEDIDGDGSSDIILVILPKGKGGRKAKSQIIAYRLF